jgi:hypothetical protein
MLFNQLTLTVLAIIFSGLALAKKDGASPCGAPFCDRKGVIIAAPSIPVSEAPAAPAVTGLPLRV